MSASEEPETDSQGECAYLHPKGLGKVLGIRGKEHREISAAFIMVDPFDLCLLVCIMGNSNLQTLRAVAFVTSCQLYKLAELNTLKQL